MRAPTSSYTLFAESLLAGATRSLWVTSGIGAPHDGGSEWHSRQFFASTASTSHGSDPNEDDEDATSSPPSLFESLFELAEKAPQAMVASDHVHNAMIPPARIGRM